MSERVYKKIRLVGVSRQSYEKAIQNAIEEAGKTLHGLSWFEVMEQRGAIVDGVAEFQVTIEIGFKIERANV
ncbi:MAG: dodecin domain-containing protein [Acidobacteria bacterium]|nr:MAG: dodecin domain-containing protein [Acidobacteriota bacterium]